MKTKLALSLFIVSAKIAFAQPITFEKPFGNDHRVKVTDIVEKPQGGYMLCGFTNDTFPFRGYVASLDSFGNLEWENEIYTPDSDFLVSHILALDSDKFILQCNKYINGFSFQIPELFSINGSGAFTDTFIVDVTGIYNGAGNIDLFKGSEKKFWGVTFIDTEGTTNLIRIVLYNENLDTLYNLITSNYNNHFFGSNNQGVLATRTEIEDWDSIQGWYYADNFHIIDDAGNQLFNHTFLNLPYANDFILKDDNGFIFFRRQTGTVDTITISRYDNIGVLTNQKKISGNNVRASFATAAHDSVYFLVLTDFDTITSQISNRRLCKFNSADDTLWTINIFRSYLDIVMEVEATKDGGCIVVFKSDAFGDTLNYILKVGPNGENVTSVFEKAIEQSDCMIYPNPASGAFSISGLPAQEFQLNIIDYTGAIKYSKKIKGGFPIVVHPELSPGFYIVKINNEVKTFNSKVIIN